MESRADTRPPGPARPRLAQPLRRVPGPGPTRTTGLLCAGAFPSPGTAKHRAPGGRHLPSCQELISGHFGEDGASYEAEIRELEDLRQVGSRAHLTPSSCCALTLERGNGVRIATRSSRRPSSWKDVGETGTPRVWKGPGPTDGPGVLGSCPLLSVLPAPGLRLPGLVPWSPEAACAAPG